jgi:hypothetical protein
MTPSRLKTAISRFRAAAYAFGATRRNAAATPSPLRKVDMSHYARLRPGHVRSSQKLTRHPQPIRLQPVPLVNRSKLA